MGSGYASGSTGGVGEIGGSGQGGGAWLGRRVREFKRGSHPQPTSQVRVGVEIAQP